MVEACDFLEVKTDLLNMRVQGNKLYIGEAPVLVVNMQTQENYVHYEQEDIPFKIEVKLSPDLLQGKRQNIPQYRQFHKLVRREAGSPA